MPTIPGTLAHRIRTKFPGAYDDLDDATLEAKWDAKYPGAYDDLPRSTLPTKPVSAEDFAPARAPQGSAVGRFFSNAGEMLNPVTMVTGLASAIRHPVDTAQAMVGSQMGEFGKARDLYQQGRYLESAGHGLAGSLPLLGPVAAGAGEQLAEGDIAGGLGKAAGLLAPAAVGAALPRSARIGALKTNPDTAAMVSYAERAGIPLDVAAATDNKFAKALQHVTDRSLAGSFVADRAAKAQAGRLATVGEQLAAKAHPVPVSASLAGEEAQQAVGAEVAGYRAAATNAYDKLRAIEAIRTPMPVDMGAVKIAIEPIAKQLAAKKSVIGSLMGQEGRAAAQIDAILSGPDAVPLSVADAALSDLKSLARTNNPNLRSVGQGLAARVVGDLHDAVNAAAKSGGPEAVSALEEGRLATKAKYAAADVLQKLEGKNRAKTGATAFRGLTQAGDTSIGQLRDVLKQAPQTKPLIARAVLDGLIDHPTAGPAKTFTDWQKLGPDTKAALFDQTHIQDLDQFFALRKRLAENPNPSGTAHNLLTVTQLGHLAVNPLTGVATQIGAGTLASLLHSPATVRLLTRGMRIPVANRAAAAAWLSEFAAATSPSGSQPSTAAAIGR